MGLASIYILISSFYYPAGLRSQLALDLPRGEHSLGSALSIAFIVENILDLSPNVWIRYFLSKAVVSFQIQGGSGTPITLLQVSKNCIDFMKLYFLPIVRIWLVFGEK